MKNAIEKAIEGGYEKKIVSYDEAFSTWHRTLLDHEFWKCLGEVLKWNEEKISFKVPKKLVETYRGNFIRKSHIVVRPRYNGKSKPQAWKIKWHQFIDHIATGKSIDSFFDQLLSNTK